MGLYLHNKCRENYRKTRENYKSIWATLCSAERGNHQQQQEQGDRYKAASVTEGVMSAEMYHQVGLHHSYTPTESPLSPLSNQYCLRYCPFLLIFAVHHLSTNIHLHNSIQPPDPSDPCCIRSSLVHSTITPSLI